VLLSVGQCWGELGEQGSVISARVEKFQQSGCVGEVRMSARESVGGHRDLSEFRRDGGGGEGEFGMCLSVLEKGV